jgi:hypothetical protein
LFPRAQSITAHDACHGTVMPKNFSAMAHTGLARSAALRIVPHDFPLITQTGSPAEILPFINYAEG